jgi:hypothetical protein
MNTNFSIIKVFAKNTSTNQTIISKVVWQVIFSEGNAESIGAGETFLPTPIDESTILPIDQITSDQIIQWVIEQEGGQSFVDHLTAIHEPMLRLKQQELGLFPLQMSFTADDFASTGIKATAATIPSYVF